MMTGLLLPAAMANADPDRKDVVIVHYAFEMEGWRPATGVAYCHRGQDCRLSYDFDPIVLTLTVGTPGFVDRISISCAAMEVDCAFASDRTSMDFDHRQDRDVLRVDHARPRDLAIHPVKQIGTIWLHYRTPQPDGRTPSDPSIKL